MTTRYWCEHALLPDGPATGVLLTEEAGRWAEVRTAVPRPVAGEGAEVWDGVVLPGMANCHSHAFHRALRGRTHGEGGTFWTWRERMYAVAARLTPASYLVLARAAYAEMALAGVSAVGEFHYVHHRPGGMPYDEPDAMDEALRIAAREAGVRLTLLDTCYLEGGLSAEGHVPLSDEQARFGDGDVAAWARRHAALENDENTVIGVAIHSVRAVKAEDLPVIVAASEGQPIHAHVSEQPAENEACLAHYGLTPTAVLARGGAVGPLFTAVHATHLTDDDVTLLGDAGATACFCPGTERDLADGIGPAPALLGAGARLSLGSDQHAIVDMFEDARGLELDERLRSGRRGNIDLDTLLAAATDHASIGWDDAGALEAGRRADAVHVTLTSPRTAGCLPEQILMAAGAPDVLDVVTSGERVVTNGQHRLGDIGALLAQAIEPLWDETGDHPGPGTTKEHAE